MSPDDVAYHSSQEHLRSTTDPDWVSRKPSRGWLKEEPSVPARDQVSEHREQVSGVATRAANTSSADYGVHEFSGQEAMSTP